MSSQTSVIDRPAAVPPRGRRTGTSHGLGFWYVAAAFAVVMSVGTLPTPLWGLYQERNGFGATMVTVIFAAVVVGTSLSFYFLGHLSDRLGRRRVIVPALITAIASAVIITVFPNVPGLLVGRLINGVAVGLMAPTATAYLADLYREAHPDRNTSATPGIVSTAANLGGLALGPLLGGILAEWAPAPLVTPYVVLIVLMVIALVLVLTTPETVDTELQQGPRPAKFLLRPGLKPVFLAAGMIGFFGFAVTGMFSSLGGIIVHQELGIPSLFVAGMATFTVMFASAVSQLVLGGLPVRRMLTLGTVLFPVGMTLVAVSLYHPALWLFLTGAAVVGAGGGLLFKGAVGQAAGAADPTARAGVLAVFFIFAYVGMGLPSILLSLALQNLLSVQTAMIVFAAVLSVGTTTAVVSALRRR
jgi:MFS family permease